MKDLEAGDWFVCDDVYYMVTERCGEETYYDTLAVHLGRHADPFAE